MREIARGIIRAPDQSDGGEDAIHSLLSLARARPLGKGGEPYVFLNGKFPVDARHLQLDADSTLRPLMRQEPRDRAALQQDLALGRPVLADQQVEERAFAGSIGTDQAVQLAGRKIEADRIDRLQAAEHLDEAQRLELSTPAAGR